MLSKAALLLLAINCILIDIQPIGAERTECPLETYDDWTVLANDCNCDNCDCYPGNDTIHGRPEIECNPKKPNHSPKHICNCTCECKKDLGPTTTVTTTTATTTTTVSYTTSAFVYAVAFDPENNDILASGSEDKSITFWDIPTSSQRHRIRNAHNDEIFALAYHNNNMSLLVSGSGGAANNLKVWNKTTYALVASLTGHILNVKSLAFDPSRPGILASASVDKTIKIWDINVADLSSSSFERSLTGHTTYILSLAFETTGLMASGDYLKFIIIWETNKTEKFKIGSRAAVYSLAFSPLMDNRLLASGHDNRRIKLWSPSTGVQVGTLTGHRDLVHSLAFSPNGLLASGSWDFTVKLWNVTTLAVYKTLIGHTQWVNSVAYRTDGLLASGSDDNTVRIWTEPQINSF